MTDLKLQVATFPHTCGCYLMRDAFDKIIYVGKARDLNQRIHQYFQSNINQKTKALMRNVCSISYITMPSEAEALLLENNLIKEHLPFYNIKLTDGKTYPYLIITTEAHPRLLLQKKITVPVKRIYGPFPYSQMARTIFTFLSRLYPFRKCRIIPRKTCQYYELGQCQAPCINDNLTYDEYIKEIDSFFKSNQNSNLAKRIYEMIDTFSRLQNYEHCLVLKQMLDQLKDISHQLVDLKTADNYDYIAYDKTADVIYIVIIQRRQGMIRDVIKKKLDYFLSDTEIIVQFLNFYYSSDLTCKKAFVNELLPDFVSKIGEAQSKDDIATLNVAKNLATEFKEQDLLMNQIKIRESNLISDFFTEICGSVPRKIDILDISHLFGTNVVGGVVVFENFVVKKNLFRYYKLDTGNNDLLSLKTLVLKRYAKVENVPDLILVDGGENQVNIVKDALQSLKLDIPVGGLKKNNKHRLESFVTNNLHNLPLLSASAIYKFLINLDETCHQFTIRKYRELKLKDTSLTKLDKIKGIGKKTILKLLTAFNSYSEILSATDNELHRIGLNNLQIQIIRKELQSICKE